MIKLDLYKIFVEVSKCKSFSKAAEALFMTQPAVSQAIMQLEEDLGIRLFTRTSKGVNLTDEGQILYEYTNPAINLINSGEKKLQEFRGLTQGGLKIGVGDTISRYFLLPYLESFHREYPNINLKIMNRTTLELCSMLKSGEIDIALCNLPIKDSTIEIKKCIDVHDIFVCGNLYKKNLQMPMTLEEISSLPLILLDYKSNSRQYIEKQLLLKGIKITADIELGSHDLLLEFAKINLGVACVVKEFSSEYLQTGQLYEIETLEKLPKRGIGFCYLKGISISTASAKFMELVMCN